MSKKHHSLLVLEEKWEAKKGKWKEKYDKMLNMKTTKNLKF